MDKLIRSLLAVVVAYFIYNGTLTGVVAVLAGVFSVVFLLTSVVSFCPLYILLGINTCKR